MKFKIPINIYNIYIIISSINMYSVNKLHVLYNNCELCVIMNFIKNDYNLKILQYINI